MANRKADTKKLDELLRHQLYTSVIMVTCERSFHMCGDRSPTGLLCMGVAESESDAKALRDLKIKFIERGGTQIPTPISPENPLNVNGLWIGLFINPNKPLALESSKLFGMLPADVAPNTLLAMVADRIGAAILPTAIIVV